jgi:uncharacterized protein (DUF433 family)
MLWLVRCARGKAAQGDRLFQRKLGKGKRCEQRWGMNLSERITVDPEQCGGKPCIRGMRIRVKDILEMLGSGMTDADILAEFPYLEAADLRASQLYAARLTDHPVLRSA